MITSHMKTEIQPTSKTNNISNILQTMNNIQHNICIMNQPLSQTFRESPLHYLCKTIKGAMHINTSIPQIHLQMDMQPEVCEV